MEKQNKIDELTEWLETHEIDDPDYADKFSELQRLEEEYEWTDICLCTGYNRGDFIRNLFGKTFQK